MMAHRHKLLLVCMSCVVFGFISQPFEPVDLFASSGVKVKKAACSVGTDNIYY
jgi:hypothetical protein